MTDFVEYPPKSCDVLDAAMDILQETADDPSFVDEFEGNAVANLTERHNRIAQLCIDNCRQSCRLDERRRIQDMGLTPPMDSTIDELESSVIGTLAWQYRRHDGLVGTLSRGAKHIKAIIEKHVEVFEAQRTDHSWSTPAITDGAIDLLATTSEGNLKIVLNLLSHLHSSSKAIQAGEAPGHDLADPLKIMRADIEKLIARQDIQEYMAFAQAPRGEQLYVEAQKRLDAITADKPVE